MFPLQMLQKLGWYLNEKTGCWHFVMKTGSECGVGFDLVLEDMTLYRYDWFVSLQGIELDESTTKNVSLSAVYQMTLDLLPYGFC